MITKIDNKYKKSLEYSLEQIIPSCILEKQIRYAVLGSGKRFRAILCLLVADIFSNDFKQALSSAVALELIHNYSLVHDDLPAMDNDDLRRGMPTLHKKFDEASAILVGDALQSLAFKVINEDKKLDNTIKVKLLEILTNASFDMVLGQKIDIHNQANNLDELINLHKLKTGAIINASILMGGIVAMATDEDYQILSKIGNCIGLAYQIQDDLLDLEDSDKIGKTSSIDSLNNRVTFVSLLGKEKATDYYTKLYNQAFDLTKKLSIDAKKLNDLIKVMQNRDF